jgi:hypothetical protein
MFDSKGRVCSSDAALFISGIKVVENPRLLKNGQIVAPAESPAEA